MYLQAVSLFPLSSAGYVCVLRYLERSCCYSIKRFVQLLLQGETVAYQLPGSVGSLPCSEMLCQRQEEHYHATQNGSHHSSHICEQAG